MNERGTEILLITGPGHGAAANLANHYLDGSLAEFYPDMTRDAAGIERFVRAFSWPAASRATSRRARRARSTRAASSAMHWRRRSGRRWTTRTCSWCASSATAKPRPADGRLVERQSVPRPEDGRRRPADPRRERYKISSATITGTMSDDELIDPFGATAGSRSWYPARTTPSTSGWRMPSTDRWT